MMFGTLRHIRDKAFGRTMEFCSVQMSLDWTRSVVVLARHAVYLLYKDDRGLYRKRTASSDRPHFAILSHRWTIIEKLD